MTTGELGSPLRKDTSVDPLREVEIAALSLKGATRLGHPGVPAPRSEADSIQLGWLERTDIGDGLYVLLATDAGKAAVDERRSREGQIPLEEARAQVRAAFEAIVE